MNRLPDARATLRKVCQSGLGWGAQRVREEVSTPTYGGTCRTALQVETARRMVRGYPRNDFSLSGGADVVAVCELTPGTIGFDFCFFLVLAEALARARGKRTSTVLFVEPDGEWDTHPVVAAEWDKENLSWRFAKIVPPIAADAQSAIGWDTRGRAFDFAGTGKLQSWECDDVDNLRTELSAFIETYGSEIEPS